LKHNQIDTVLDLDGNRHGIGVNEKIQYGPLNGLTKAKVDLQIKKERRCLNKSNFPSSSYFLIGQNVLLCSINTLKRLYDIFVVEVGQHFYWQMESFQVHAQVLITSWVVIAFHFSHSNYSKSANYSRFRS